MAALHDGSTRRGVPCTCEAVCDGRVEGGEWRGALTRSLVWVIGVVQISAGILCMIMCMNLETTSNIM